MRSIFSFSALAAIACVGTTIGCAADVPAADTDTNAAGTSESEIRVRAPLERFWTTYGRHVIYEAGDVAAAMSVEFLEPGVQELQLSRDVRNAGSAFSVVARENTPGTPRNSFPSFAITQVPTSERTAAALASGTGTFSVLNGAGRRVPGYEIEYASQSDGTLLVKQRGVTVRLYATTRLILHERAGVGNALV